MLLTFKALKRYQGHTGHECLIADCNVPHSLDTLTAHTVHGFIEVDSVRFSADPDEQRTIAEIWGRTTERGEVKPTNVILSSWWDTF